MCGGAGFYFCIPKCWKECCNVVFGVGKTVVEPQILHIVTLKSKNTRTVYTTNTCMHEVHIYGSTLKTKRVVQSAYTVDWVQVPDTGCKQVKSTEVGQDGGTNQANMRNWHGEWV